MSDELWTYGEIADNWLKQQETRRVREASYGEPGHPQVWYDNGRDAIRDATDLYTVLSEDHTTGSPNLENTQALALVEHLQRGGGLGEMQIGLLRRLMDKHRAAIDELRSSRDRDGQDILNLPPAGAEARIIDPPAPAQESAWTGALPLHIDPERGALRRLREPGMTDDDRLEVALQLAEQAAEKMAPGEGRDSLRDAVGRLREASGDLLTRVGLDPAEYASVPVDGDRVERLERVLRERFHVDPSELAPAPAVPAEQEPKRRTMAIRESLVVGESDLGVLLASGQLDNGDHAAVAIREANAGMVADGQLLQALGLDPRNYED